ncbi:MAG: RICIN domain-containing protein, partial [Cyanobacteria bacterium]|nr:RICIN domain-containing protein [Cyanobacteriota bacterium]
MGGNECRKPSRCVEAIEHFENVVNSNGSSASVRSLESWIGSASQNKNCAVAIAGGPIVSAVRNAVAAIDLGVPNSIPGSPSGSFVKLRNKNSGRCLNLQNATQNGVAANAWECVSHPDQEWKIEDAGNGFVKLRNKNWR